jgi:hypothetical protein
MENYKIVRIANQMRRLSIPHVLTINSTFSFWESLFDAGFHPMQRNIREQGRSRSALRCACLGWKPLSIL